MHRGSIGDDELENGELELERWRNISFSAQLNNREHPAHDTVLQEGNMSRNEQGVSPTDSRKGKSRHENEVTDISGSNSGLDALLSGSRQYGGVPGLDEHRSFMDRFGSQPPWMPPSENNDFGALRLPAAMASPAESSASGTSRRAFGRETTSDQVGGSSSSRRSTDDLGTVEDKRKRNTEASARFRMKKKQHNVDLEQTITELSGRAVGLEREAEDLRRENGWLKEIVIMKSKAQREAHDGESDSGEERRRGSAKGNKGKRKVDD